MTPADQAADWVGSDRKYIAITLGGNTRNSLFLCAAISTDERRRREQRASSIELTSVPVATATRAPPAGGHMYTPPLTLMTWPVM
jgi:hypothetical protein